MSGAATPAIRLQDLTLGYDRHPGAQQVSGSSGPAR